MTHELLAKRMRSLRVARGMSQQQVAKAIGIHRPAMTLIEDGRRKMNSLELYKLCKLYGVMVDALFMGEKDWQHIMVEVTSDEGVWR